MSAQSNFVFDIPRAERLSRGLIFVKWLLFLPHALILYTYSLFATILGIAAFFAILFTGSHPVDLWTSVYRFTRWQLRVSIYIALLRDEYPPFGDEPYPMQYELVRPERQSRSLAILRWFYLIPVALWMVILAIAALVHLIIAWFAILFTGNIREGTRNFLVRFIRHSTKFAAYAGLLTDTFPGFRL